MSAKRDSEVSNVHKCLLGQNKEMNISDSPCRLQFLNIFINKHFQNNPTPKITEYNYIFKCTKKAYFAMMLDIESEL